MANRLVLGIDTGGTHTDAVLFDPQSKAVLASAKAPTTHYDLSLGISEALSRLLEKKSFAAFGRIAQINLSTTLATNSVAEGHGAAVGLLMIGYDSGHESVMSLTSRLPLVETRFFAGGHDFYGRELEELKEDEIEEAVRELEPKVGGWAVSGMFAIKNSDHEIRAASIIQRLSQKPVTMGRDLTGKYDAVRRAATAALNAGLVPVINRLLDAVKKSAQDSGLDCKLMVVRGDGSLVSEEWARARPIETVVSGPAASLLGARILGRGLLTSSEDDLWVMDVGGTTTDLAYLKNGRPVVDEDGARIGRWHTMTTAVRTGTRGLGGDSRVDFESVTKTVLIGPRRVVPLCRLAEAWPQAGEMLKSQRIVGELPRYGGVFFLRGAAGPDEHMTPTEKELYEAIPMDEPLALSSYVQKLRKQKRHFPGVGLIRHPAIMTSSFTPTDAMAIVGLYNEGVREAALIGAEIIGRSLNLGADEVAGRVLDEFGRLMAQEISAHSLDQAGIKHDEDDFSADGLLGATLGRRKQEGLEITLRSTAAVFLLGGPAGALAPFLSRYLEGRIIVPPVSDTANAVGAAAAAAPIALSRRVEIHLLAGRSGYRLFLPDEVVEGWSVEVLAELAKRRMKQYMSDLARWAGAEDPVVRVAVDDRKILLKNGRSLHLGASLTFTVEGK